MSEPPQFYLGPGEAEPRRLPPAARSALACGGGCLALIALQAVFIVTGIYMVLGQLGGTRVALRAPREVKAGSPFQLEISLENQSSLPVEIVEVTLDQQASRKLKLEKPDPKPVSGPFTVGDRRVWTYRAKIEPGGRWNLKFEAVAPEEGRLRGSFTLTGPAPREAPFDIKVQ